MAEDVTPQLASAAARPESFGGRGRQSVARNGDGRIDSHEAPASANVRRRGWPDERVYLVGVHKPRRRSVGWRLPGICQDCWQNNLAVPASGEFERSYSPISF